MPGCGLSQEMHDAHKLACCKPLDDTEPPCPWPGYHQPGVCEECDEHHGPVAVAEYAWKLDERWA